MKKLLLDAITATDATKREFMLNKDDFEGTPVLRGTGLGVGDTVTLWVQVAGIWEDTGLELDNTTNTILLESLGVYAVSAVLTLLGPVSVEVTSSGLL